MDRIERVFRLFKETVLDRFWLIASRAQLARFCTDFLLWHNRDRPHGGWEGRTPDEVFFGSPVQLRPLGRVTYFDGALPWHRFGRRPAPGTKRRPALALSHPGGDRVRDRGPPVHGHRDSW